MKRIFTLKENKITLLKDSIENEKKPKEENIDFLISFSKSLEVKNQKMLDQ